ncbi:MAG TPA: glycoside hydrolase family 95 protein, partial [Rhizomicrobium sp.]
MRCLHAAAKGVVLALGLSCAPVCFGAAWASDPLTLWYDRPATSWEREALPIGHGAMGAMLSGGVAVDDIQFNEKTLWTGGPGAKGGYDFGWPAQPQAEKVAGVQAKLAAETRLEPEAVAQILGHDIVGYGDYQSFGNLILSMKNAGGAVTGYRRSLDIAKAMGELAYSQDGVSYRRQYFASYPDSVIVVRLTADKPGRIAFSAKLTVPDNRSAAFAARDGRITVAGALHDNGLKYEAQLQVLPQGGTRSDNADGTVTVAGADAAMLILSAGTDYRLHYPDYRGADPHDAVTAKLTKAVAKSYEALLAAHAKDYEALFGRLQIDLAGEMPDVPTDALLAGYGKADPAARRALEALHFQFGRYLLIAASRPGSLPANLQGVWNESKTPPWNADYHVNINLQMNYWLAETGNLPGTAEPLIDFVEALVPPGEVAAGRILGSKGWTLFLNTNIWGHTGLIAWPTAFWQPEAGAWLASQLYDHYRFTQDAAYLKRLYPILKGAAATWLDALIADPRDGRLVVSPSYSPEHGPFSAGAAMSQQIVEQVFRDAGEAADAMGDTAFAARLKAARDRLDPGLKIGRFGQLQEWKEDWDDPQDEHRHVSQLYALHPGNRIAPATEPALAAAARATLKARGDGGTGWSKAWKINFWARLGDGDHAHS